jgi:hypothetical protein
VVAAVASVLVDILAFIIEMMGHILIASARPWKYVFSARYRDKFNQEHAQQHPVFKWITLLWGSVLLVASMCIIGWVTWLIFHMVAPSYAKEKESLPSRVVHKIAQAVDGKIRHKHAEHPTESGQIPN